MNRVILITGGTGLLGKLLIKNLVNANHKVRVLSRSRKQSNNEEYFEWDYRNGYIDLWSLENVTHVIHLAGANIAEKRWTTERKKEIIDSRVESANVLFDIFKKHGRHIESFISCSAVGIYGYSTERDTVFDEQSPSSDDFPGNVCKRWEQAADKFSSLGARVVKLRLGVVLSGDGGAFMKIAKPISMGIGSPVGTGTQYIPWIHIEDVIGVMLDAIDNKNFVDAYNLVAPQHLTNAQLTHCIGRALGKKIWLPNVPAWLLKLTLGEVSNIMINGNMVTSNRIQKTGYQWKYPTIELAVQEILKKLI